MKKLYILGFFIFFVTGLFCLGMDEEKALNKEVSSDYFLLFYNALRCNNDQVESRNYEGLSFLNKQKTYTDRSMQTDSSAHVFDIQKELLNQKQMLPSDKQKIYVEPFPQQGKQNLYTGASMPVEVSSVDKLRLKYMHVILAFTILPAIGFFVQNFTKK